MAKKYVERLSHSCGTSDALQVIQEEDGRYTGFCFACHTYIKDPYADKPEDYAPPKAKSKSPEEQAREVERISKYPIEALKEEKINKSTMEYFNVRVGFDQETASEIRAHYYPYEHNGKLLAFQAKLLESKKFWSTGEFDRCEPFGWRQALKAGGRKIFITEGQKDALALFQILKRFGNTDRNPAVISLHNGTKSVDKMRKYLKQLDRWADVIMCFDMDKAGKEAAKQFSMMYPKALQATYPLKDSHDMLMAGRERELFESCVFRAKKPMNDKLVRSSDVWDRARVRPKEGLSWPWPHLTEMTRGIRRGEGYYFGAGVKMGKSCIVNEIGEHLISEHDTPVFFCKPEEENHITAQKLAGVAVDRIFHDPRIEFDEEAFERGKRVIDDKAIMYGEYGQVSWSELKKEIRYVTTGEKVKDVIIDPITCLTVGMGSGEANEKLIELASELASMSKELDFTYYVFCHLNAPSSGVPHERGGKVQSVQFAGSRGMMRSCYYMIGLEGNKDPERPELKNLRHLSLLEDRNFGETGRIDLLYNPNTGRLLEGNLPKGDDDETTT